MDFSQISTLGALYPGQGFEMFMFIAALLFWLGWHILQLYQERHQIKEEQAFIAQLIKREPEPSLEPVNSDKK